ncbi:MAG: mannose-6-phosphate isomerase, class I [Chitinophagaceae bacterium]|nr:mannose-6-phosphate isomerase, class I [Chitinophagaceae bacterium]
MQKAYKLQGKHRHYDWGGNTFLPNLMGVENVNHLPYAEYWMGTHPLAASTIQTIEGEKDLSKLINEQPVQWLGKEVAHKYNALPYLYKILDVHDMLSIQVHPSKQNAVLGFKAEQAKDIAIDAANRNYKDENHKPEIMVALSDFWLLHGFLPPAILEERLNTYSCLKPLMNEFRGGDYQNLYSFFMQLPMEASDSILKPLLKEASAAVAKGTVTKNDPHFWAHKYYADGIPLKNIDKGIFSIYILNIVYIPKYQGIFQGAGILHAYLEGQNIELMANSDNVLRGGLTPKHVDVKELIQHVNFVPTYVSILKGKKLTDQEINYPCPVPDFSLTKIVLNPGDVYTISTYSLEMLLVMDGEVIIEDIAYKAGDTALLTPNAKLTIKAKAAAILFKSYVPK